MVSNVQEIPGQLRADYSSVNIGVLPANIPTIISQKNSTKKGKSISSCEIVNDFKFSYYTRDILVKYRGLIFALVSSFCFASAALIVTYLKEEYDRVNIATWRFQGSYILAVPLMAYHHKHRKVGVLSNETANSKNNTMEEKYRIGKQLKIVGQLMFRSAFTCNSFLLSFYALKYLSVGDVLVINSSAPVFVNTLFAYLFLREKCGKVPIFASLIVLCGVICIVRPPILTGNESFDKDTLVGTCLAFGAAILSAIASVLLRHSRNIHYSTATFIFGAWGTVESMIIALAFQRVLVFPDSLIDWVMSAGLASLTFFGQISIILALKYEKAGPVSLIRSIDVLFCYLGQVIFWKIVPDAWSLVGASIVCCAVVVIGAWKWFESLPETRRVKITPF